MQMLRVRGSTLHHLSCVFLQFAERAVRSQPSKADAEKRASRFKEKYVRRLNELKQNPWYALKLERHFFHKYRLHPLT